MNGRNVQNHRLGRDSWQSGIGGVDEDDDCDKIRETNNPTKFNIDTNTMCRFILQKMVNKIRSVAKAIASIQTVAPNVPNFPY